eukprot:4780249-Pleurochrysis_carterae.AAC.2
MKRAPGALEGCQCTASMPSHARVDDAPLDVDAAPLDVDDARELLQPVKEQVALLDRGLVLRVARVGPGGGNNAVDLVDLAAEALRRDEAGELRVEKVGADAERGRHRRQAHRAVAFEELRVRQHANLAPVVARVQVQVAVGLDRVDHVHCDQRQARWMRERKSEERGGRRASPLGVPRIRVPVRFGEVQVNAVHIDAWAWMRWCATFQAHVTR